MINIEEKIKSLPQDVKVEIYNFIEFMIHKHEKKQSERINDEKEQLLKMNEASLKKIWDNQEDDIYNELLKR